ncbi:ATP-binding cassette domain-containing protein [Bacillus sp. TH11]|nr:ATP-binding cassette domain-containing protein [Bacillus sp. TH11]
MNLLLLKNVKKSFSGKSVLEIDELAIKQGKINGFLGRNGAGKSTTIKIIMGVLPKDQGEIFFDNQEIHFDDKVFKNESRLLSRLCSCFRSTYNDGAL